MLMVKNDFEIIDMFPTPVYKAKRDVDLDSIKQEEKEIKDIIKEGLDRNEFNSITVNTYIFNTKLKNIKEFCEKHIKIYVKEIIKPKEEMDFYITQSWFHLTEPGEKMHEHTHQNSIISGVFYLSDIEDQKVYFIDASVNTKERLRIDPLEYNAWNASSWFVPIEKNNLLLFPSWIPHKVSPNDSTVVRISLAFNVFARGIFGDVGNINKLILR